jgi:hypothetical protein
LLGTWLASRPIIAGLKKGTFGSGYPTMSWYCLLAGVGLFPEDERLRAPTAEEGQFDLACIDNLLDRSALNFPDHAACLADIPPKVDERSLQMYLW